MVGALVHFALLVKPATAASRFTSKPVCVIFWSAVIGKVTATLGLTIAAMINSPQASSLCRLCL